jgi:hypothetical protein
MAVRTPPQEHCTMWAPLQAWPIRELNVDENSKGPECCCKLG